MNKSQILLTSFIVATLLFLQLKLTVFWLIHSAINTSLIDSLPYLIP